MSRLPTIIAIVVSLIAVTGIALWATRSQPIAKERNRLMAQSPAGAPSAMGASAPATPGPNPSMFAGSPVSGSPPPMRPPDVASPGAVGMMPGGGTMPGLGGGMLGGGSGVPRRLFHSGTIQPAVMTTITSPLAGNVTEILVKDGDTVRAGQKLMVVTATVPSQRSVTINAPQSGVVIASLEPDTSANPAMEAFVRFPRAGRHVEAGAPLLDVANDQSAVVLLNIPERDIVHVKTGQEVTVRPVAWQGMKTMPGKVIRIGRLGHQRSVNNVTATVFSVTVQILAPLDEVKLGMTADVIWSQEIAQISPLLPDGTRGAR